MHRLASIAVFVLLAMTPRPGHADSASVIEVGTFSSAPEGAEPPNGWRPLTFPKIPRHTRYELIKEGDAAVVRAVSEAAASGLVHEVRVDLKDYPILQWRWKVEQVNRKSDVHTKQGDDYAARIYVTFEYDPDAVSLAGKAKYRLGRLLFGEIPIAAINYVWENSTPKNTIVPSPYTDFSRMIVIENAGSPAGQWIMEERNVYEDYKRAFGEEPPPVNG
ncbi:MAG: DUF3047 domain-containing protein, partial [Nitrospirota bacterium]